MREFRSDLPALLHKKRINIEPVTITVSISLVNLLIATSYIADKRFYAQPYDNITNFNATKRIIFGIYTRISSSHIIHLSCGFGEKIKE
jgi:hypothetical protein